MNELTHDRCSELLGPYARGELTAPEVTSVEEHLHGCAECSEELRGMAALMSGSVEPMSAEERAALHAAIEQAARGGRSSVVEILPPLRERNWGRFVAPALAAAAALLVVVMIATIPNLLGSDDADTASGGGGGEAATAEDEDSFRPDGPEPVFAGGGVTFGAQESLAEDDDGGDQQAATESAPAARTLAVAPYRQKELERLGRTDPTVKKFARAYDVVEADFAPNFLELLANQAPDARLSDAVLECGTDVLEAATRPVLPAYAEYAPVEGSDSLIIVFAASGSGGQLDEFMVWVWEDADCATPDLSLTGNIRI